MKLLTALPLLLLSFQLCSQEWLQDKEQLKGNVKSVHYQSNYFFGEDVEDQFATDEQFFYNTNGFLTRAVYSNVMDGREYNAIRRIFNEDGDRCLEDYFIFDGDEAGASKTVFTYNKLGKAEKSVHYSSGAHWSTTCYVYNEAGLLAESIAVVQRDQDTIRQRYLYDAAGRWLRHDDISSSCIVVKNRCYDDNGDLMGERSELEKAPPTIVFHVGADGEMPDEGQLMETNPDDDRNYYVLYTYNDRHQVVQEVKRYLDQPLQYDVTYTYNENGDADAEFYLDPETGERSKTTLVYEYDTHGNWTKKSTFRDGSCKRIEQREITYY